MPARPIRALQNVATGLGPALAACVWVSACDRAPERPTGTEPPADAAVTASAAPELETRLDLLERAAEAHVSRGGVLLDPGAPGWWNVSEIGGRTLWLPPRPLDRRDPDSPMVAWSDGIGASLWFPVGPEDGAPDTLSFWMRGVQRGQAVSVFMDETPLATVELSVSGRTHTLTLPEGLEPGEHHLRFYWRFTRFLGRTRTAAAIRSVRITKKGAEVPASPRWIGHLESPGADGPALFAGAPARWSWYVLPPAKARFQARAAVTDGAPVTFIATVLVDGEAPREVVRGQVNPGSFAEMEADLGPWAGRPIRLTLTTEGGEGDLESAGWLAPAIRGPGLPDGTALPAVRNVVLVTVDRLRGDRVGLGSPDEHAATPNLDLLARDGAALLDVWSGGPRPADGHARIIQAGGADDTLPHLARRAGLRVGFVGPTRDLDDALLEGFAARIEPPGGYRDPAGTLTALERWVAARRDKPFFLYVALGEGIADGGPPAALRRLHLPVVSDERARARAVRDARLTSADYWVGQVVGAIHAMGLGPHTAIVVAGTSGEGRGRLAPGALQVPLVVWHPALIQRGAQRAIQRGGDLADVAPTVLSLLGKPLPPDLSGRDLSGVLFGGIPLTPRPVHAQLGGRVAVRLGRWYFRSAGINDTRLWDLGADPSASDAPLEGLPIAIRALRDSSEQAPALAPPTPPPPADRDR
jgi:hypothetical protein